MEALVAGMAVAEPVPSQSAEGPVSPSTEGGTGPEVAILFVGVSLFLGVVSRQLFKNTRVPYTVALLLLGVGLGALEYGTKHGLGLLGVSIHMWAKINPNLILFIFLPALLFESSFAMEVHQIKRCLMQMVLLAGPGVVISTFFLGTVNHIVFPYGWNWSTSLLLGGLLSATDPVAVVALLKELGASKKLSTLIEGESLMNDGTAIVVFRLFLNMVLGQNFNGAQVIQFLCRVALGAVGLGLFFGIICVFWLGLVFNDTIIEITLTLTASYMAFFVAEDEAEVSGVLTVMTVGIFFAAFARTAFTGESQESMHHFWEMISYIANTLIFILSGVVIAESILRSHDKIQGRDWAFLVLLYVFVQLSRAVVVGVLYQGLRFFGYGLTWKEAAMLIWAGLRGAVALSLSLSVAQVGVKDSLEYTHISKLTEARFVFFTGGVVFLTLIINGSTTQFLLHFLKMDQTSETKSRILEYAKYEMYSKALEAFGELGEDEELGPAEWTTVKKYVSCMRRSRGDDRPTHPHESCSSLPAVSEEELRELQLQDTRFRLMNGVQAAYWSMLEEGRITQTAALLLMQSVDQALDKVAGHEAVLDWKGLQPHVHFPQYLKFLQWRGSSVLPQRFLTFLIVERLELACYISAAFLRSHRIARHQLRDFIGESEIAEAVIKESEDQEEEARQFLEDIRLSFPQVLRVVKTKQVTYAILLRLSEYVKGLEQAGLLESRETLYLHDAVQVDLKKLLRNPPLVKMPTGEETLTNQPLIGAMPAAIQRSLANAAKESMKLRGSILYKEDSKPVGVWLIANGVVKWSNKLSIGKHLLHPTFSYGSTLGLYETLTGKRLLCNIMADSVVHCFFIDRSKIAAITVLHPELENFFWQESALVVAKIVLPQHFEVVTMQELRALIMEGSTMRTFLRGEVVELLYKEVGILLEGFVKREGSDDMIAAPAGLTFLNGQTHSTQTDSRSSSLLHQCTNFHVEARSRILFVDLGYARGSASHSLLSLLVSRRSSREHDGLLRWPTKPRRLRDYRSEAKGEIKFSVEDLGNDNVLRSHEARCAAKAMELSLFGSKVISRSKSWKVDRHGRASWPSKPRSQSSSVLVKRKVGKQSVSPYGPEAVYVDQDRPGSPTERVLRQALVPFPPVKMSPQFNNSSDDSDGEEHIVEIDSPSILFLSDNADANKSATSE